SDLASAAGLEGDSLIAALAAGLGLDEDAAARTTALARALTAPSPAETVAADAETADQSARALSERARRRMTAPVFEDEGAAVRVGGPTSVIGQEPSLLVLAGFVNGFFPTRDYFDATVMPAEKQKAARAADIRRLYAAVGKAGDRLATSWFTALDLVTAERLKLEIGRVRLRRGERIATTAPSIYLKEIASDDTISA
ncbi:DNA helicase, partial [Adlercreutzia muris]|nr:DNA helicase [Adlercreutzia muris]